MMQKKWLKIFLTLPAWILTLVLTFYRTGVLIALAFFMLFMAIMNIPIWINKMVWKYIYWPILSYFQWILDIINWITGIFDLIRYYITLIIFWPIFLVIYTIWFIVEFVFMIQ